MIKAVEVTIMIAGPIEFVAAKNVDTDTGEESKLFFRMKFGEQVIADMGEEAARLFISQVQQTFARQYDNEWTRQPIYAAVEADRHAVAQRRSA
ncbi:MAG: hypothetical protein JWP25_7585 [Bradyrhizobium sp.]|nr:hypothetical protein [Bradyrhizobium sp.]